VLGALGSLAPDERGATVLHLLEGVDLEELARLLRRPEEAVVPLIERGIATLGQLAANGATG
jgi:DNA-directed RNA polymerase specialized sigma24 family protein